MGGRNKTSSGILEKRREDWGTIMPHSEATRAGVAASQKGARRSAQGPSRPKPPLERAALGPCAAQTAKSAPNQEAAERTPARSFHPGARAVAPRSQCRSASCRQRAAVARFATVCCRPDTRHPQRSCTHLLRDLRRRSPFLAHNAERELPLPPNHNAESQAAKKPREIEPILCGMDA